jgi:hypothetical protein
MPDGGGYVSLNGARALFMGIYRRVAAIWFGNIERDRMPASRIAFALADAMREIMAVAESRAGKPEPRIDIMLDITTYEAVVKELEYHHGAQLKADQKYRDRGGVGVRYAGARILMIPPGH